MLTRDLHHDFLEESHELQDDIEGQIAGFANFEQQKQRVDELEQRILKGRERAERLDERLSKCRERVTLVEKKDAEEAEKAGRFYKMLWATLGTIVAVLFSILIVHHVRSPGHSKQGLGESVPHGLNRSAPSVPTPVREILQDAQGQGARTQSQGVAFPEPERRRRGDDERLRIFDEL